MSEPTSARILPIDSAGICRDSDSDPRSIPVSRRLVRHVHGARRAEPPGHGVRIFDSGKTVHPPFVYAGNWFRSAASWVGNAEAEGVSQAGEVEQLREALSRDSAAGVIVANGFLLGEVEQRGWEVFFHDEWRLVWYRDVPGQDAGFDRLAVFVRADMPNGD